MKTQSQLNMGNVVCRCSFCPAHQENSSMLIHAPVSDLGRPQAFICAECVGLCVYALEENGIDVIHSTARGK